MKLAILGTHGIPAQHGGFETFAERLALHLVERGWETSVYCPAYDAGTVSETRWRGIRLLHLPVAREDAIGTISFDWQCTRHAAREGLPVLNLGYGTAIFGLWLRLRGVPNLINMDGIEWRREKWSLTERAWLYTNERIACLNASHLIADHPEIARHLGTRTSSERITMIPYGADAVENADPSIPVSFGLEPNRYALVVARPDPDNSILEIVKAFGSRSRGLKLLVLGGYNPQHNDYHRRVMEAAGAETIFQGGIYDCPMVEALRFHCRVYIHGHRVGGTNPSLVEALAAGSPVIAHDNPYNRWVAGNAGRYFATSTHLNDLLDTLLDDSSSLKQMSLLSRKRHGSAFTWEPVLKEYERLARRFQIGGH